MPINPYEVVANWLEAEAVKVRDIEKLASNALYENKDENLYRELLQQKAMLLASLADRSEAVLEPLNAEDRRLVQKRVKRFSMSASKSLQIGSVFFMSALLYPDDYKDGDENDLEDFIRKIRNMM